MLHSPEDCRINYVELNVHHLERAKWFYSDVFGWTFTDRGPDYAEFSDGAMKGCLTTQGKPYPGGPLLVLYADNLGEVQDRIIGAGGSIVRRIYKFRGGRRLHFTDLDGYELAVWSKS